MQVVKNTGGNNKRELTRSEGNTELNTQERQFNWEQVNQMIT